MKNETSIEVRQLHWVIRIYDNEDNLLVACVTEKMSGFWAEVEAKSLMERIPYADSYELVAHDGDVETAPIPLIYKDSKIYESIMESYKVISANLELVKEIKKAPIKVKEKVGRNDPCPCGKVDTEGKPIKFKKCCGKT